MFFSWFQSDTLLLAATATDRSTAVKLTLLHPPFCLIYEQPNIDRHQFSTLSTTTMIYFTTGASYMGTLSIIAGLLLLI